MAARFEGPILAFVKQQMLQDQAHDIHHILRVVKTAKQLCQGEGAQIEVVLPAAYLHDCVSLAKNHPDRSQSSQLAAEKALSFLRTIDYPQTYLPLIHHAIVAHSYSANIIPTTMEAQIVQDADRLDALGAIGIARCLQVSCELGVDLYHPDDPFCLQRAADDRRFAIDHFYLKLFKLADSMNTESARAEAQTRTQFMRDYLAQLSKEV
ncbi:HD domain-containing protein [Vibrio scophthalmi]|uniref:HD domain-containing protein n=1 Tax=Vibrio scophthalmi TaxID=45658 RepID=UPI0038734DB9